MLRFILTILLNALLIYVAAYFLGGVYIENYPTAIFAAIILGIINWTIKPLLTIITLPLTIVTFGIFLFIINGLMVMLAAYLIPGFAVANMFWAILFTGLLSILNYLLTKVD